MRRFGLFGLLVLLLLVGVVGAVSYDLGVSAGAADAAIAQGAAVIYTQGGGISPLGMIAGLFVLILLIGFIARAAAGPRTGWGAGGWGRHASGWRSDWHNEDVPEPFRPMLERWHASAHARGGPGPALGAGLRAPVAGPPAGPAQRPR